MSHALLLRLFLSPSFFTVHVALQYLRLYSDNIGITYYLTRRLRELELEELREVWGFICHLLVTRPSSSRALECFVVEVAQKSTHVTMLTLWYMQAALKDLGTSRHDTASFLVCQRVLNQCHEIIFGDIAIHSTAPYGSFDQPVLPGTLRKKISANVQPALVGIGIMLAGVPALPQLTDVMGEAAVEQGRVEDHDTGLKAYETEDDITGTALRSQTDLVQEPGTLEPEENDSNPSPPSTGLRIPSTSRTDAPATPAKTLLSRRKTIGAQTSPALPLHLKVPRKPRLSEDPFGQNDPPSPVTSSTPFQSTPTLTSARHNTKTSSLAANDLLQRYDSKVQMWLLRSHYCRSEVEFLLTLENICNKLLVIPKPARVSALRAELTGLNHMLPAEVCMPMWCSSTDKPRSDGIPEPHHRIVRIPPGESVVLNSAERAPYLLLIEILHGDLDFDPVKRSNREILKKIVVKESERKGASRDLISFNRGKSTVSSNGTNPPPSALPRTAAQDELDVDEAGVEDDISSPLEENGPPSSIAPPEGDEEIDLVEQLYGTDDSLRLRTADLSESIVLPPAPKNRDLDMVTWSRSTSMASGGRGDLDPLNSPMPGQTAPTTPNPNNSSSHSNTQPPRVLSLDEYSERMRTAAVMLAQLNANLVREAVAPITAPGTPIQPPDTSASRWFPSSSWITGSTPSTPHPGDPTSNMPLRMKLQYAEAQAIRNRIMEEMLALEDERMQRMRENGDGLLTMGDTGSNLKTAEDEGIIRRELSKADPSAVVFSESWAAKKSRIRQASPYGHLANWDCVSVIVKTGGDLRQEQLAVQLIQQFEKIWKEENCPCWVRYFRILITGNNSGLVETITDAVSIHSIKKAEYARRLAEGRLGHVTLYDHFKTTYGDPSSAKFARAQRNFAKSLAGYSLVTYFLQIKDRHNGNILLDRDGHLIHIDFGFMLSNSPGNIGFEAAPFKFPLEYLEVLGGLDSEPYREFKRLFKEGYKAAQKHCDRIITMVELMQKDSAFPCFAALGEQTANQLRDRFQQGLTQSAVDEHVERLIETSLGSNWTRLYDSYQYYSQSIF
ncbi:kinase-like protein [Panus rudis PR-1116 ss-1]|nr:kinase-like protein [Panus rudis PR-1116 ss-1]